MYQQMEYVDFTVQYIVYTALDPQIEYEFNYFRYLNFGPKIPKQSTYMQHVLL